MSLELKIELLRNHSIQLRTISGHLLALNEWMIIDGPLSGEHGCDWVDITNWTKTELLNWLGY